MSLAVVFYVVFFFNCLHRYFVQMLIQSSYFIVESPEGFLMHK